MVPDRGYGTAAAACTLSPTTARIGGTPIRDVELLDWCRALLDAVVGDSVQAGAAVP